MARTMWVLAAGGAMAFWKYGVNRDMPLPAAISAERRTFTSNTAGRLSYYVDTSGDGKPLVLIHSINAAPSSHEVRPLFDYYRGKRPVYALDLPGFGFSERSDRVYDIDLYVTAIVDLLKDEVGDSADLIALSLGCEFVAQAALRHPDLVNSLTLISPSGLREYPIEPPGEAIHRGVSLPIFSQALFDGLTSKRSVRYFTGQSFYGEPDPTFLTYAYLTSHQPGARFAPLYFVSGQLFNYDVIEAVYKQVNRPTLVLYDQDPNVTFDRLPDVLAANSNWQVEKIVPTKGLPHWEQLDATVTALDRFWR